MNKKANCSSTHNNCSSSNGHCSTDNCSFVISCSGACDLGGISDLAARKLYHKGIREMKCLAAAGAGERNHDHNL